MDVLPAYNKKGCFMVACKYSGGKCGKFAMLRGLMFRGLMLRGLMMPLFLQKKVALNPPDAGAV
jgi:hypothetical protein